LAARLSSIGCDNLQVRNRRKESERRPADEEHAIDSTIVRAHQHRLKQFRRIATRYEKTARAYLSMLCIAAARLWIKTVNTP
jgi:transposase